MNPEQQPLSKKEWFSLVLLLFSILLCFLLIKEGAHSVLDGDASSELVLSNLLAKENAIISTNWFYSTELRVLNTQLVYAPLFHILSSWYWVRVVGATILNLLLVYCYMFMMKSTGISKFARFSSAALLLLPLSIQQARIVNLHTYYIPHIAIGFLLIGLILRMKNEKTEKIRASSLLIFLLLSFFSGLGGIRQLMVTLAPLFMTMLLNTYSNNTTLSYSLMDDIKRIFSDKTLIISIAGIVANLAGVFINTFLFLKRYHFSTQILTRTADLTITRIIGVFQSFFYLLGFRSNSRLFSLEGALSVCAIALFTLVLVPSINYVRFAITGNEKAPYRNSQRFLWVFFAMSFFINTFLFVFTDAFFYELYYFPVVIMIVPLVGALIDDHTTPIRKFPHATAAVVLFVFVLNGMFNTGYLILRPHDKQNIRYGGLTYENVHLVDQLRGSLHFLEEQGLKQGYATFWHANVIREMSNGNIDCTGITFPQISIYNWLTETYKSEKLSREGASFLLLSANEHQQKPSFPLYKKENTITKDPITVTNDLGQILYSDDHFYIIVFPNDQIFQNAIHGL